MADGRVKPPLDREVMALLDIVGTLRRDHERIGEALRIAVVNAHDAGASYWDIQTYGGVPLNTANKWVRALAGEA